MTQLYPTVANKVTNKVPYKAVANLHLTLFHPVERSTVSLLQ